MDATFDLARLDLDGLSKLLDRADIRTENTWIEFKASTSELQKAAQAICGFLNACGGLVLFGVNRDGKIVGQDCSDATLQEVADIARRFEPSISPLIRNFSTDQGRQVIGVQVRPTQGCQPYVFDGKPYERVGNTTRTMAQETYRHLLMSRTSENRWETLETQYPLDLLDTEEIQRTIRLGIQVNRIPEAATDSSLAAMLERLHLISNGRLLNAAVVLFGKETMPGHPQCLLKMARFKGTTKSEFIDNRLVRGHAFFLLAASMSFLRNHLPVAGRIQAGVFEREDEPLFPTRALREALVNAFCHRDYVRASGSVSLAVFDDRLEIANEGNLPAGLQIADLKRDHPSKPRNPIIADVFYLRGLLEQWGRGTQDIVHLCTQAGHPEPHFEEVAGTFLVRFVPSGFIAPHSVSADLSGRQRQILHLLSRGEPLAFRAIRGQLEDAPADRTLRDELYYLKKLGLIRSEGFGRGAVWSFGGDSGE